MTQIEKEKLIYLEKKYIYEISEVQLVALTTGERYENSEYEEGVRKVLNFGFFYSFDYDLTRRKQKDSTDDRYWWNKQMYSKLINAGVSSHW